MPRLTWGSSGERFYETGIDRGVLYPEEGAGVSWTGLTSVAEAPTGGTARAYYLDGVKYLHISSAEEFEATISAFTYPDEFIECEGTSSPYPGLFITAQRRRTFGLSYRTLVGNDIDGLEHGYKIHLIYNALAEPSQRANATFNDSPGANNFSWKITTKPPVISGFKRTAHFIIDSRHTDPLALAALEEFLYGSDAAPAAMPTTEELLDIFINNSSFVVVDNGDGSWTATGTDSEIVMLDATTFEINAPGAVFIDAESYTLTSP
jgi:hypothetical protein